MCFIQQTILLSINWKRRRKKLATHPITAPMSCPIIETEFEPNELINCNNSSHIWYGVYSLRHSGLSESPKPFKSRATTWKKRDNSLICKNIHSNSRSKYIVTDDYLMNCHETSTWCIHNMICFLPGSASRANNRGIHAVTKLTDHFDFQPQCNAVSFLSVWHKIEVRFYYPLNMVVVCHGNSCDNL